MLTVSSCSISFLSFPVCYSFIIILYLPSLLWRINVFIKRVQALADILRSAPPNNMTACYDNISVYCRSNATRAPIINPPNRAQLEGTHYHPRSYIRIRAVVWECRKGQTDTETQTAVTNIHFASAMPHPKCYYQYCSMAFLTTKL